MGCIILKSEFGERKIPEYEPYTLLKGETVVGVDWNCNGMEQRDVEAELAKAGVPWGKAVAYVAQNVFGIKSCSACKAREYLLDHINEKGLARTAVEILKTFK
jgi:hypothetical protein